MYRIQDYIIEDILIVKKYMKIYLYVLGKYKLSYNEILFIRLVEMKKLIILSVGENIKKLDFCIVLSVM